MFLGESFSVGLFREDYGPVPWANDPADQTVVVPVIEDETPTVGSSDEHIRQFVYEHLGGPDE